MSNPTDGLLVIERLLRDRDSVWRQIIEERGLKELNVQMLVSAALSLALYGAVLGASNGWLQALSSFVKMPLLFLATLAICLPTLYLFNLVFGARLSVVQAITLIMVSITVTAVLTLAFAPISLFFLITAQSYSFFKLLNVAILVLTAVVGLRFLTAGMTAFNAHQVAAAHAADTRQVAPAEAKPTAAEPTTEDGEALVAVGATKAAADNGAGSSPGATSAVPAGAGGGVPALAAQARFTAYAGPHGLHGGPVGKGRDLASAGQRSASMTLLYIWILLFGFVGTQLAWTLRPFFGSPGKDFALFREIGGTFYSDVLSTIGRLLGG